MLGVFIRVDTGMGLSPVREFQGAVVAGDIRRTDGDDGWRRRPEVMVRLLRPDQAGVEIVAVTLRLRPVHVVGRWISV